jgi:hypothetical protein
LSEERIINEFPYSQLRLKSVAAIAVRKRVDNAQEREIQLDVWIGARCWLIAEEIA